MTGHTPIEELMSMPYKKWYQFGVESPNILYKRLKSKYYPVLRVKTAYQRVRYGIADSDCWSLDYFLADVTIKGIQNLIKYNHGHPPELTNEEYINILTDIQVGFQAWVDNDGWFSDNIEEEEKYNKAMDLYKHWFSSLWD